MKTLGRILIILVAFALVSGVIYAAVSAGSTSSTASTSPFERGNGERPEFARGDRDGFRSRGGGMGWIFDFLKNIGVVTIVVALVTSPKNLRKRKTLPANAQ